jgi:hypothetical protein
MNKAYYAIKVPERRENSSYIWWFARSEHDAWTNFFVQPDQKGHRMASKFSMGEAIDAYKAIGYKCIKLKITEIEDVR